jgi:hypothetical protein
MKFRSQWGPGGSAPVYDQLSMVQTVLVHRSEVFRTPTQTQKSHTLQGDGNNVSPEVP